MAFYLFLFIYSVLLSLICTYIPDVCNVLHLDLLAASFIVIFLAFLLVQYVNVLSTQIEKIYIHMYNHYEILLEFLLVLCILNYKYYEQLL